jgi:hypothetical protein
VLIHLRADGMGRAPELLSCTARASLASGDRAEHRDTMSLALPRNAEDLLAAAAQPLSAHLARTSAISGSNLSRRPCPFCPGGHVPAALTAAPRHSARQGRSGN